MSKEYFKLIPAVFVILEKEGKVLLARRYQTGHEDGNYGLPSGHLEGGETMREAAAREAKEEIGITSNLDDLQQVVTLHRNCGDHERVDIFFLLSKWEGEVKNMEPNKCDHLEWFRLDDLPANIISYVSQALSAWKESKRYTEYGW